MFLTLLLSPLFAAEPPSISLEEAVSRSEKTLSVQAAEDNHRASQAQYAATWPSRLPTLNVQANVLVYDSEQTFSLVTTDEPIDCTGIPDPFGALCNSFGEETVVRDQVTSSLTLRMVEPLTGQFAIDRQVAAAKASADASEASVQAAIADAQYTAQDAWFGAVQAEQQVEIAEGQVKSLESRVRTAEAAFNAGTLTRNDLLLAQIALSQARQAVLQLHAFRDAAYGRLGLATGTSGTPVRPEGATMSLPAAPGSVETLVEQAIQNRPDLVAMRLRVKAATASAQAASWSRLPSIAAMGVYQHQEGQGLFASPDSAYGGLTLDWNVWAWGKAQASTTAARAAADGAAHQLEAMEAGIRLEVQTRVSSLQTAISNCEVSKTMVAQAEENLSIQERRQASGLATMQELLDAELAVVRAKSGYSSAVFDAHRAAAALRRAVGGA